MPIEIRERVTATPSPWALIERRARLRCRPPTRAFIRCGITCAPLCTRSADCAASANGTGNSWQIFQAPMKGAYCDAFYEACKGDFFCSKSGSGSFFDTEVDDCATLDGIASNCKSFEELYGSGQAICEKLWDEAFVYVPETNVSNPNHNASDAFVWHWPANETNPNPFVLDHVEYPDTCNATEHDEWVEFDIKELEKCDLVVTDGTGGNETNGTTLE